MSFEWEDLNPFYKVGGNQSSMVDAIRNSKVRWIVQCVALNENEVNRFVVLTNYKEASAAYKEACGAIGIRWSDVMISKVIKWAWKPGSDFRVIKL